MHAHARTHTHARTRTHADARRRRCADGRLHRSHWVSGYRTMLAKASLSFRCSSTTTALGRPPGESTWEYAVESRLSTGALTAGWSGARCCRPDARAADRVERRALHGRYGLRPPAVRYCRRIAADCCGRIDPRRRSPFGRCAVWGPRCLRSLEHSTGAYARQWVSTQSRLRTNSRPCSAQRALTNG